MGNIPALPIILILPFLYAAALTVPVPKVSGENLTELCSRAVDPTFCVESLESDPRTAASDLRGLANISVGLATSNVTAARRLVERLAEQEADPVLRGRYEQCSGLYREAVKELKKAERSVGKGDFGGMGEWASMVLEKSEDCSDEFTVPPEEPAQLKESNRNVQHLCNVMYVIAVAIVG
ncbi:hypothetical protein MLD38_038686 [Melastoma candidum]|uniref:Uncharacterized protein n=1 Tax=Melastoma candidum TaxID=119954 RepID=A0ACB9KZP7_9MYRT|nr:hypothetical protein MLD38_038686 [Melastoma candidum]